MRTGRLDEALSAVRRALYFNPLSLLYRLRVGEIYLHSRRYDEALTVFEEVLDAEPNLPSAHFLLGQAYLYRESYEDALQAWQDSPQGELGPAQWVGIIYAAMGRREEALQEARDLIAQWQKEEGWIGNAWVLALIYARLDDKNQALDWLERAYEVRYPSILYLKIVPEFDPLHSEPRFQALLEKVGLA